MENENEPNELNSKNSSIETLNFGEEEEEKMAPEIGEGESSSNDSVLSFNDFNEIGDLQNIQNTLQVEEEVFVKEEERIYQNDLIYLKELESMILATYPVTKQALLYIQQEASTKAQLMIDAKNDGLKRYLQYENGFEYPTVEDAYNLVFSNRWIIPVIMDKHKIFSILQEDTEVVQKEGNEETFIVQSLEDESGIKKESQIEQQILLKRVKHDSVLGKISFKDYIRIFHKIQAPYLTEPPNAESEVSQIGYYTKLQNNALVLRYHDIDTVHWNSRNLKSDFISYKDKYDEETGRVIGLTPYTLVGGENVQMVGFMVIPQSDDFSGDAASKVEKSVLSKKLVLSSKITKISQVGDFIKITAPNHGLTAKMRIYIDNTNCVPNINGMKEHMTITIENENEFSIKSSKKLNVDGTYGEIFTVNRLAYDRYQVKYNPQIDDYMTEFKSSTYGEEKLDHHKLYLFDELRIENQEQFRKLLVKIVPTLDQIMELETDKLSQCYTFQEVEHIFQHYGIKVNDLKIDQLSFIKSILKSNIEKLRLEEEIQKRDTLPIFHIRNKERFSDKNFFLADYYITNPEVTKYYGEYSHLQKTEDCVSARLIWLMEQRDHGTIFFSEMMKLSYGLFKESQDMDLIQKKIQEYDTLQKSSEKQLHKESQMENQLRKGKNKNKNKCCELYRYQVMPESEVKYRKKEKLSYVDGTIKLEENQLQEWDGEDEKWKDVSGEVESGMLILMGKEVYQWDAAAESWTLTEMVPKYDKIEYVCTFRNTELEELDIETLDSIYRKEYGCHSKLYIRFKERLEYYSEVYQNFVYLKEYLQKDDYVTYFEDQIQRCVQKYYVEGKTGEEEKKEEEEEEVVIEKVKYDELDLFIRKIYGLKDYEMLLNYIYQWIDKDGLLIGKDLYSKKYKKRVDPAYICGHYVYKNRERKTADPVKKSAMIEEMVNLFGDQGEASGDVQTCTHCGQILTKFKDDDVEGYTENGQQIRSRDVWTKDEEEEAPQTVMELSSYESEQMMDCDSKEFRKIFLDKKFSTEDFNKAQTMCTFIQKNLCAKTGITLRKNDLVAIIIDSVIKHRNILQWKEYAQQEVKKLIDKGFGKEMISKMIAPGGKLEEMHKFYEFSQLYSIMASRFLISIQTAIPAYSFSSKLSPCVFTSFEGIDGIQYMACLLIEMGAIQREGSRDETMELSMNVINDNYMEFKKSTSIHQLYIQKREYQAELAKKMASFNTSFVEDVSVVYEDRGPLPENFISELSSGKDIGKKYNAWKHRIHYLNQELKKIYMEVYNQAELRDVNPESSIGVSMIEKACCDEYIDNYLGFIYYVEEKSGNVSFSSMIEEVRSLYKLRYLFHPRGTYHRSITTGEVSDSYFTHNDPVYVNTEHTSQEIIQEKFAMYVDEGALRGTLRFYVGSGKERIDKKSGKTYDEIISKTYSVKEYEALLDAIASVKQSALDTYIYSIYLKEELLKLKSDVQALKDKEIMKLLTSLQTILHKGGDKTFYEKYDTLLRNIGYYQYYMTFNEKERKEKSKKELLKNDQKLVHVRLQYLKKCYNDYLRKYLAMIKNGKSRIQELQKLEDASLLPFEENDIISREVQSFIYQAYESFESFYDPTVRSYFMRAKLKKDAKMIQSIHGEDDLYNSEYKEILKFADYSFQNAAELLHYFFVKELNDLILCNQSPEDEDADEIDEGAGEENLTMNAATMSEQCKYRCLFILFILDKIAGDSEWLDEATLDIERMKSAKSYAYLEEVQKAMEAAESDDYTDAFTRQLQYTLTGRTQPTTSVVEEEGEEDGEGAGDEAKESLDMFVEKAKANYYEEYGMEMPADMLENMKEEYLDKMYNEELAEQENENVQDGAGEYGGIEVDADFTADELAFAAMEQ